jgi:hypothetical protein
MPAAFAHALTQAYEAKPRGQRYFKKEEVEALVAHLAAMDPQLFQQRPLSDKQVSSVFPRDRVLSLQGPCCWRLSAWTETLHILVSYSANAGAPLPEQQAQENGRD